MPEPEHEPQIIVENKGCFQKGFFPRSNEILQVISTLIQRPGHNYPGFPRGKIQQFIFHVSNVSRMTNKMTKKELREEKNLKLKANLCVKS